MVASVFHLAIAAALSVQAVVAAPPEPRALKPNTTLSARAPPPTVTIHFNTYPESAENICYDWYCNNGPMVVHVARASASANRAANSCGNTNPNRCSTRFNPPHVSGYQCDEWPWASTQEGGRNAATRCIPSADNTGSGSVWGNFINNRGSQAIGRVINDGEPVAVEVDQVNSSTATFCLGVSGTNPSPATCSTAAAGQPSLQRVG